MPYTVVSAGRSIHSFNPLERHFPFTHLGEIVLREYSKSGEKLHALEEMLKFPPVAKN